MNYNVNANGNIWRLLNNASEFYAYVAEKRNLYGWDSKTNAEPEIYPCIAKMVANIRDQNNNEIMVFCFEYDFEDNHVDYEVADRMLQELKERFLL